MQQEEGQNYNS